MPHADKRSTVPQLFTPGQWWVFWHTTASDRFPILPPALASLSDQEKAGYASRGCLLPNIETAAQSIWESKYRAVVELMLKIYHMRPKDRNSIQHAAPSAASTYEFMESDQDITEEQETIMRLVVEKGTRLSTSGEEVFLFERDICAPGPSDVGKCTTRRREVDDEGVDDEGIPAKKKRREE